MAEIDHVEWYEELALDPQAHPVAMGTRSLGERPWIVSDEHRALELELKAELLSTKRDQVLHTTDAATAAAIKLAKLVDAPPDDAAEPMHAIERAARWVQEDLCLLNRRDDGWYLDASCLCSPTRWHLQEKVGLHIAAVHGPVDGYDSRITSKVDRLFDQLNDRPVWRRNWFLMTDPTLFQPDRPPRETIVERDRVRDDLLIRSERQTLRRLSTRWVVFTIRIQQEPLGRLLTTPQRANDFENWVKKVSPDFGHRRHLTAPQRREILAALAPTW